jgi:hypothetical protein
MLATQQGPQVRVVRNMIARILGTDNELVPDADSNINDVRRGRDREPLGLQFQILKGREVFLR